MRESCRNKESPRLSWIVSSRAGYETLLKNSSRSHPGTWKMMLSQRWLNCKKTSELTPHVLASWVFRKVVSSLRIPLFLSGEVHVGPGHWLLRRTYQLRPTALGNSVTLKQRESPFFTCWRNWMMLTHISPVLIIFTA